MRLPSFKNTRFRISTRAAAIGILLFVLLGFGSSLSFDFLNLDDNTLVYNNPNISKPRPETFLFFFKSPYKNLYMPLTYSTWSALALLSQTLFESLRPEIFHGTNILLHSLNSVLVFLFCLRVGKAFSAEHRSIYTFSLLGSLLFAFHPLQVETVAWVSNLKDLLYTHFSLLACLFYTLSITPAAHSPRRRTCYYFSLILFLLALLSKPTAVMIPLFLLILATGIFLKPFSSTLFSLIPWFLLSFLFGLLAGFEQSSRFVKDVLPFSERILVFFFDVYFYLKKLVVPLPLGPDYGLTPSLLEKSGTLYIAWLLPAAIVLVLCLCRNRRALLSLFGLFITPILPVSGLLAFLFQGYSVVADRYVYFSLVAVSLLAVFIGTITSRRRLLAGVISALVLVCVVGSYHQLQHWKNSEMLFRHTITINPQSFLAHTHLGITLKEKGRLREAARHLEKALELERTYLPAVIKLGETYLQLGDLGASEKYYLTVLQLSPSSATALNGLGIIMVRRGNIREAVSFFQRAISVDPTRPEPFSNLGIVFDNIGRHKLAREMFRECLKRDPDYPLPVQMKN